LEAIEVNLEIWLPAMFISGIAAFAGLYLFLLACEKI
jgi:hypothetical protein